MKRGRGRDYTRAALLVALSLASPRAYAQPEPIVPVVEGEWWSIANNPTLPDDYQSDKQEPVDFAVWQAAGGTWQLWSCIRKTNCGGHTRLLYGWEADNLTDTGWTPRGIQMESDPALGEPRGGLQAPHVIRLDDRYVMAYGNWESICFAESRDGKRFKRIVQPNSTTAVFGEGPRANTRDPMLIQIGELWHCYYTAILDGKGYGLCRTSPDLGQWSDSFVVSYGGFPGASRWQNECPHVVEPVPGEFVYFRNQYYGEHQTNWAYYSRNPRNFGIDSDAGIVARLDWAAPEIVHHDGQYYVASLKPTLDGIQMARLAFYRRGGLGKPVINFDTEDGRAGWRIVEGAFPFIFTRQPHQEFDAPQDHVIGTSQVGGGAFDDTQTGVIESPPFALSEDHYYVFVSGGGSLAELYVAIVDNATGEEIDRWTGHFLNAFLRHSFSPRAHAGKTARIRIVDKAQRAWGHINFGGIYTEGPRTRIK